MIKPVAIALCLLMLAACRETTHDDALEYYRNVRYEIAGETIGHLNEFMIVQQEYLSNPGRLTEGPDPETHQWMLEKQQVVIGLLNTCVQDLEATKSLGDDAMYKENLKVLLRTRLEFEQEVDGEFLKRLEGGLSPEEMGFLEQHMGKVKLLKDCWQWYFDAEAAFCKEFGISESELVYMAQHYGY